MMLSCDVVIGASEQKLKITDLSGASLANIQSFLVTRDRRDKLAILNSKFYEAAKDYPKLFKRKGVMVSGAGQERANGFYYHQNPHPHKIFDEKKTFNKHISGPWYKHANGSVIACFDYRAPRQGRDHGAHWWIRVKSRVDPKSTDNIYFCNNDGRFPPSSGWQIYATTP